MKIIQRIIMNFFITGSFILLGLLLYNYFVDELIMNLNSFGYTMFYSLILLLVGIMTSACWLIITVVLNIRKKQEYYEDDRITPDYKFYSEYDSERNKEIIK